MRKLTSFAAGLLFGLGLLLSGMANPAKVIGFLDLAGAWDPSLAFVMGGALIPSAIAYLIRRRMETPVAAETFHVPESRTIDTPLVAGAVLFGLGWGLVGLCPGPALAALTTGAWQAFVFVGALVAGMALFRLTLDRNA